MNSLRKNFRDAYKKFSTDFIKNQFSNFSTLIVPQILNKKIHPSIYHLTTAASQLDNDVHVLLYSNDPIEEETINFAKNLKNVTKVITYSNKKFNLNEASAEHLSALVSSIHKHINKYDYIITPSNNFGKNFLPRVGGSLDIQPISDVAKIDSSNKNIFYRYFYAGNAMTKLESNQKPNLLSIRLTSFDKSEGKNENPSEVKIEKLDDKNEIEEELLKTNSSTFVENLSAKSDKTELTQAKVVVSGGRALKSAENFKLVEELAECFENSAIGASRAAVDAGYVPNDLQVGQTGKVVAPDLYFAIGISGAIQHVAGMKDSKVIVAINSDPDSPVFNIASYGLVGDLFKILPELTDKIKKIKNK
jgi:electron transfer flavoprotein alpha subunit